MGSFIFKALIKKSILTEIGRYRKTSPPLLPLSAAMHSQAVIQGAIDRFQIFLFAVLLCVQCSSDTVKKGNAFSSAIWISFLDTATCIHFSWHGRNGSTFVCKIVFRATFYLQRLFCRISSLSLTRRQQQVRPSCLKETSKNVLRCSRSRHPPLGQLQKNEFWMK